MLGLGIKITGSSKSDLLVMIDKVRRELENNNAETNMFISTDDAEADYSICEVGNATVFDNWDDFKVVKTLIVNSYLEKS
jgi:hypothetical protein